MIQDRMVETNTLRMHIAEAGAGPLVLLCHHETEGKTVTIKVG